MSAVDFVVNCYERTYREVLAPGFVRSLAAQQIFPFDQITVLINNVLDRADADARAHTLLRDGEVSRVLFVADHIDAALSVCGLRSRDIRRLQHFSDCCLVAVTIPGPDVLVYWDADAVLREPHDWISPTLDYMDGHSSVVIGNPANWHEGLAEREALSIDPPFALGYGFSDVAFLARRGELARPVFRKIAPASWRYPLAHVEPIFEQRVDAWMRRSGRLRATYLPAVVTHPAVEGINYPRAGLRERVRGKLHRVVGRWASRWDHPATRAWPEVEMRETPS